MLQYDALSWNLILLYVKPIIGNHRKKIKMLYVMGATWHTKCMFDLDTVEDSFADILHSYGIETYAADIFGSGPANKPKTIGDLYCKNLEYLATVIDQFDIRCVMGYSSGCSIVKDLTQKFNFDSVVLLDPGVRLSMNKQLINNDKFVITKQAVRQALLDNGTTVTKLIANDYIDALTDNNELVTASYPVTGQYLKVFSNKSAVQELYHHNVKTFFTKNSLEHVKKIFPDNSIYYPEASHWILLEKYRYVLAQDVVNFLNS